MTYACGILENTTSASKYILAACFGLFILIQTYFIMQGRPIWWDEAVYQSMGLFMSSFGQFGFWETLRPPALPVALSLIQWTGAPLVVGRLLATGVAVCGSILIYILLKKRVPVWVAIAAAAAFLFHPLTIVYSQLILTGIMASVLILLGLHLYLKKQYVVCGLVLTIAFFTRFPAALALIGFGIPLLISLFRTRKPQALRNLILFCLPFTILFGSWAIVNIFLYSQETAIWWHAALRPLLFGFDVAVETMQQIDYAYYLKYLLYVTPALVFLPFIKKDRATEFLPAILSAALFFVFFSTISNQQYRFATLFLPLLIVLVALGISSLRAQKPVYIAALILFVGLVPFHAVDAIAEQQATIRAEQPLAEHMQYFQDNPVEGTVLTSDPRFTTGIRNDVDTVYFELYPLFHQYLDKRPSAVLYVPENFPCTQSQCNVYMEHVEDRLQQDYVLDYSTTFWGQEYRFYRLTSS